MNTSLPTFVSFRLSACLAFVVVALGLFGSACRGEEVEAEEEQEETQFTMGEPIADTSLAVIVSSPSDSDTLTTAEFEGHVQRVTQQFAMFQGDEMQMSELRRMLVEQFAISHALARQAAASGLTADTAEVASEMDSIKTRFGDEVAFRDALAQENMTESDLRDRLTEEIQRRLWQERVVEAVEEPTESDVESFRQEQAEQVRAQHILFYSPTPDSALEAKAQAVLDSAKSGVDFSELARRHSDDGTAEQGGDLDYFSRSEMVKPFADAAFALSDSGDVADEVVRTQFGYHVIRLTGRRTGDLMPSDAASQSLLRTRQEEALRDAVDRLREEVVVRVNPDVVQVDLNAPRS